MRNHSLKNNITIKKLDLVESVHRNVGLTKTESSQIVDQIFGLISDSLARGNNVKLANFGTFQLADKASRLGRNPRTNEPVPIPPRRAVMFKPSAKLSERIITANNTNNESASKELTKKKKQVLNALGNKIGTELCELDFLFNSASETQIHKDVNIPDTRNLKH